MDPCLGGHCYCSSHSIHSKAQPTVPLEYSEFLGISEVVSSGMAHLARLFWRQEAVHAVSGAVLLISWKYILRQFAVFEGTSVRQLLDARLLVLVCMLFGGACMLVFWRKGNNKGTKPTETGDALAIEQLQQTLQQPVQQSPQQQGQQLAVLMDYAGVQAQALGYTYQESWTIDQLLHSLGVCESLEAITQDLKSFAHCLFNISAVYRIMLVPQRRAALFAAFDRLVLLLRNQQDSYDSQITVASLQASWVLLQLSLGPEDLQRVLLVENSGSIVSFCSTVVSCSALLLPGRGAVVRNVCWSVVQFTGTAPPSIAGVSPMHRQRLAFLAELLDSGFFTEASGKVLGSGVQAAGCTLAALSCIATCTGDSELSSVGSRLMLSVPCFHAVCAVLNESAQEEQCRLLLLGGLQHLIDTNLHEVLRILVTEQLVGEFLAVLPVFLGQRFVLSMLSSKGQAAVAEVHQQYAVDVPLALIQVVCSRCNVSVNAAARVGDSQTSTSTLPAVSTRTLACRLLLRDVENLRELFDAFLEDVMAMVADPLDFTDQPPSVLVTATGSLFRYIMSNNMHMKTNWPTFVDSCSSLDDIIASYAEDSGFNRPAGLEPTKPVVDGSEQQCWSSSAGPSQPSVTFIIGTYNVEVPGYCYDKLRQLSSVLRNCLSRAKGSEEVTLAQHPHLTTLQNYEAFCALIEWVKQGRVAYTNTDMITNLWILADLLEVDAVKLSCESVIAEQLNEENTFEQAMRIVVNYTNSAVRLKHLCFSYVLKGGLDLLQSDTFQRLLQFHHSVMLQTLVEYIRDCLVTLCLIEDDETS